MEINQAVVPSDWISLTIVPIVVGAITGAAVTALVMVIEHFLLETVVLGLPSLWFAVPAIFAFVLTRFSLTKIAGATSPGTAELYPTMYHDFTHRYPLRQVPGRLLSGLTTVGLGGSQGLESQSVMLGDSIGIVVRRLLGRSLLPYLGTVKGRRLLLVCGASAGIATVFSSPILGAMYGVEMPFKRALDSRRLVPAFLAAVSSFLVAYLLGRNRSPFFYSPHDITLRETVALLVVALLCGFGARYFAIAVHKLRHWKDGGNPWLRALGGGVGLAALASTAFLVTGVAITAGPGYVAADWVQPIDGGPSPGAWLIGIALVLRAGGVLVSVAAGGGGGVFTSMAVNGLFIGVLVAQVFGLSNVSLLAVSGGCAFLGAGYRLPLASAGLVIELTGSPLPSALGMAAIAIAYICIGEKSASDNQRDPDDPIAHY